MGTTCASWLGVALIQIRQVKEGSKRYEGRSQVLRGESNTKSRGGKSECIETTSML